MEKIIAGSMFLHVIFVFANPYFSDDIYRYIWDGRVSGDGINPYLYPPDSDVLRYLRDENWKKINFPFMRTIYPPVSQMIFFLTSKISETVVVFKLVSSFFNILVAAMVYKLTCVLLSKKNNLRNAGFACAAYALNPLVCLESGMSGHLEPAAVFFLLVGIYFFINGKTYFSLFLTAAAAGIKLIPLVLAPVYFFKKKWSAPLILGIFLLFYIPFYSAGFGLFESTDMYARKWEGNAGIFACVKTVADFFIYSIYNVDIESGMVHLNFLDRTAEFLQGTFFSLHKDGLPDPNAFGSFSANDLSLAISKIICLLLFGVSMVFVIVKKLGIAQATYLVIASLFLLSPVVHPWYILWVLPFAAIFRHWFVFILAALMPLSYLPLDNWIKNGVWYAPAWIPTVEYGVFTVSVIIFFLAKRNRPGME